MPTCNESTHSGGKKLVAASKEYVMYGSPAISDPLTDTRIHTFTSLYADVKQSRVLLKCSQPHRQSSSQKREPCVRNLHVVNNGCRIVTHRSNNTLQNESGQ